ncbi:MAG: hypothetical protein U0892_09135 [Pirellulales bacterium]
MAALPNHSAWEQKLVDGLGTAPAGDFEQWKVKYVESGLQGSNSSSTNRMQTRRLLRPILRLAAAVLLSTAGIYFFVIRGSDKPAVAAVIQGVDSPRSITWTTVFYSRMTSADGNRTWIVPERRLHAYRSPGQYRETRLDDKGEAYAVEITDVRAGRTMFLDLKSKKAVLSAPKNSLDIRGPFAWVGEALRDRMVAKSLPVKSVSLAGKKEFDNRKTAIVRAMIDEGASQVLRRDFLFDESTKGLVGIWLPNEKDFDVDSAPDLGKPAEEKWSTSTALGYLEHQIVVDADTNADDFSLEAPVGYEVERLVSATVTEEEMTKYLGAAARFNQGTFPDSPFSPFDSEQFNAACQKAVALRTPAEADMIAQHDKFLLREIHRSPVRQFLDDHTVPGSFHYLGAGVKLDSTTQLIGWFKPKGESKLRGIFSDLSVRDLQDSEVPFELSK